MMDGLCCLGEMQAAVDAIVDDADYGSKGIVVQLNGMSELMCQDFEMFHNCATTLLFCCSLTSFSARSLIPSIILRSMRK